MTPGHLQYTRLAQTSAWGSDEYSVDLVVILFPLSWKIHCKLISLLVFTFFALACAQAFLGEINHLSRI